MKDTVGEKVAIELAEWSEVELSADLFAYLSRHQSFWSLVERQVVRLRQAGIGRTVLESTSFVGQAQIADCMIRVTEKVPGTLQRLLTYAAPDASRVVSAPRDAAPAPTSPATVFVRFVDAAYRYASGGLERTYSRRTRVGGLVKGRLLVAETMRLRARGFVHRVAFEVNELRKNTPKNRLVFAALRRVDRLGDSVEMPALVLARARGLAHLFADSRDVGTLMGSARPLLRDADRLIESTTDPSDRELIALAALVLAGASLEHSDSGRPSPDAWFVDLAPVFESAIRSVLGSVTTAVSVTNGADDAQPIFERLVGRFTANPDIVIRGGGHTTVGDAKYKRWSRDVAAADVYQLLVHATAFKARRAFLVYPHSSFEVWDLGLSTTGCHAAVIAVELNDLEASARQLLSVLGVIESAAA